MRRITMAIRGRSNISEFPSPYVQMLEVRGCKTSTLTSVGKDNMILEIYERTDAT